jgi:hypothetical protein
MFKTKRKKGGKLLLYKTRQIEACISPKLQFDEFFGVRAKICKNTHKIRQITACDVQKKKKK